ncbi:MAG: hypothetical protein KGJ14_11430, partial [Nitrospirota bacterium]|nr:hypothetical protein [Nitrospirota bacterium]
MALPPPSSLYPTLFAATLVLVVGLGWASARDPESFWAPGDLSIHHAGRMACTQCHEPFRGATTANCLACHAEATFASQPDKPPQAFHRQAARDRTRCLTCHTEHRGATAKITTEPLNPHGEFIFRVTGTQSCQDCHVGGKRQGPKYGLLDND